MLCELHFNKAIKKCTLMNIIFKSLSSKTTLYDGGISQIWVNWQQYANCTLSRCILRQTKVWAILESQEELQTPQCAQDPLGPWLCLSVQLYPQPYSLCPRYALKTLLIVSHAFESLHMSALLHRPLYNLTNIYILLWFSQLNMLFGSYDHKKLEKKKFALKSLSYRIIKFKS